MNSEQQIILATFVVYFLILFTIGIIAWRKTNNLSGYILGNRTLGRWTTAISACASDMSGWLLLGLPGFAYLAGFKAIWIAAGLFIGSSLNWIFVAAKLRILSEKTQDSLTLPEFLENHFKDQSHQLRIISAFFILFFYILYTSSGLVAGGKLFESVFGLPYSWAVITGTMAILVYTVFGGFLAVCWTDLFQGLLMAIALVFLSLVSLKLAGGWDITLATMRIVDTSLVDFWKDANHQSLSVIAICSLLGWGLGYFGQPHILVRFMAINSVENIQISKWIAITWTGICLMAALLAGFTGIVLLETPLQGNDTEKVFIELTGLLLHPVPAGICLAAILSAIMSTADSQLLVASSAITEDICYSLLKQNFSQDTLVFTGRLTVIIIAMLSMYLAINFEQNVLDLVAYAWAGFGAAFGPVLLSMLYWKGITKNGALAGIIIGGFTVIGWHQLENGLFELYEMVPGFIFASAAIFLFSKMDESFFTQNRKTTI